MTEPRTAQPPKRADAQRNITTILDAGAECLSRNPEATMSDIAKAAGLGRVTIYGHFPSRAQLVDDVFAHVIGEGEAALATLDLSGDPRAALALLIDTSWMLVARSRSLLLAAQGTLPPGRIRTLHARPADRVQGLVERGQAEGVFRADLPASWLVSTLHNVMHGAADEINAGRLDSEDAAGFISATVLSAFTPPCADTPDPARPASVSGRDPRASTAPRS